MDQQYGILIAKPAGGASHVVSKGRITSQCRSGARWGNANVKCRVLGALEIDAKSPELVIDDRELLDIDEHPTHSGHVCDDR
jgi:hypothetical protein